MANPFGELGESGSLEAESVSSLGMDQRHSGNVLSVFTRSLRVFSVAGLQARHNRSCPIHFNLK